MEMARKWPVLRRKVFPGGLFFLCVLNKLNLLMMYIKRFLEHSLFTLNVIINPIFYKRLVSVVLERN